METRAVFVYGTLRPGEPNWRLIVDRVNDTAPARLDGHALYGQHRPFPYATPRPGAVVHGDLISIDPDRYDQALAVLDRLEGYRGPHTPHNHYDRHAVTVTLTDGHTRDAWIYLAGTPVADHLTEDDRIPSGDWHDRDRPRSQV